MEIPFPGQRLENCAIKHMHAQQHTFSKCTRKKKIERVMGRFGVMRYQFCFSEFRSNTKSSILIKKQRAPN